MELVAAAVWVSALEMEHIELVAVVMAAETHQERIESSDYR
jgi:hypothetical protein